MATKIALISFQFSEFQDIKYNPNLNHDFTGEDPLPNYGCQPLVHAAFQRIRRSMARCISPVFRFGTNKLHNIDNFIHIGHAIYNAEVAHSDGTTGETSLLCLVKFYRVEPLGSYSVNIDLEEMPSSGIGGEDPDAYTSGFTNQQLETFVNHLDIKFGLQGAIDFVPIIRRGRYDCNRFLQSSDERVIEYDFQRVVYHKSSQQQDIKIVKSPSLGNVLLLNNCQNRSECDSNYTDALMDRGSSNYRNKHVLVLGGGDGSLLDALLLEGPTHVTMVEIDSMVIEACRQHMRPYGQSLPVDGTALGNHKFSIIIEDCMTSLKKFREQGKKFDFVINDLTDIPITTREESHTAFEPRANQKENVWHYMEGILVLAMDCLKPKGSFLTHSTGVGNEKLQKSFQEFLNNSSLKIEYKSRTAYVPSFMENWVFFTINHKATDI